MEGQTQAESPSGGASASSLVTTSLSPCLFTALRPSISCLPLSAPCGEMMSLCGLIKACSLTNKRSWQISLLQYNIQQSQRSHSRRRSHRTTRRRKRFGRVGNEVPVQGNKGPNTLKQKVQGDLFPSKWTEELTEGRIQYLGKYTH